MMKNIEHYLVCPINEDFLEEPISTLCCGNIFSRQNLKKWLEIKKECPICRKSMDSFDIDAMPTLKNIVNIIDEIKKGSMGMPQKEIIKEVKITEFIEVVKEVEKVIFKEKIIFKEKETHEESAGRLPYSKYKQMNNLSDNLFEQSKYL